MSSSLPEWASKPYFSPREVSEVCRISVSTLNAWLDQFSVLSPTRTTTNGRLRYSRHELEIALDIKELFINQRLPAEAVDLKCAQNAKIRHAEHVAIAREKQKINTKLGKQAKLTRINMDCSPTAKVITEICGVHTNTARRYLKTGIAPYAEATLLDLHLRGEGSPRVLESLFY